MGIIFALFLSKFSSFLNSRMTRELWLIKIYPLKNVFRKKKGLRISFIFRKDEWILLVNFFFEVPRYIERSKDDK